MEIIVESLEDMVKNADVNKMLVGEPVLLNGIFVVVKYVRRGELKGPYMLLDDAVESKIDFPVVREDVRKDISKFYNTALTNFVNKKLVSGLCDVHASEQGRVTQTRLVMGDYEEDRNELVSNLMRNDDRFAKLLSNVEFPYRESFSEDVLKEMESYFKVDDDVIPLLFIYKLDFMKLDNVKLPTSSRLRNGNTLLLLDPTTVLPNAGLKPNNMKNDTIVFTDDATYYLGRSFAGNITIREIECGELSNVRRHAYKLK